MKDKFDRNWAFIGRQHGGTFNISMAMLDEYSKTGKWRKHARNDGNRVHKCSCGCGFIARNGRRYLKGHCAEVIVPKSRGHGRLRQQRVEGCEQAKAAQK